MRRPVVSTYSLSLVKWHAYTRTYVTWVRSHARTHTRTGFETKINSRMVNSADPDKIARYSSGSAFCSSKIFVLVCSHYENTPIQINWKFHHQNWKFSNKNSDFFYHISALNIDCGYSLEPPRRGGSTNLYFWAEIRKIMYTPSRKHAYITLTPLNPTSI